MDKARLSQKDKLFKPERIDPYQAALRSKGSAFCADCGANYHAGRWSWQALADGVIAERSSCPACRRKADNAPAGTITLSGPFVLAHHQEIVNLINHVEQLEKTDHPLERLMRITPQSNGLQITTTGMHLANRICHALDSAFQGHSNYRYNDQRSQVDIDWSRNA